MRVAFKVSSINPGIYTGENEPPPPMLDLIFSYSLLFNAYEAWSGQVEHLTSIEENYDRTGRWVGSARDLRGVLFLQQRSWSGRGTELEVSEVSFQKALTLYNTIQEQIRGGERAPNDGPSANWGLAWPVTVDGEPGSLMAYRNAGGLVLTVAIDSNGEVVEKRCPPTSVETPNEHLSAAISKIASKAGRYELRSHEHHQEFGAVRRVI